MVLRPSAAFQRTSALTASLIGAAVLTSSLAGAQTQGGGADHHSPPARAGSSASPAAASPTGGISGDLRGAQTVPTDTLVAPDLNPTVPYGTGTQDTGSAIDDFAIPPARETIEPQAAPQDFDLFSGPESKPAGPANLALQPAGPNAAGNPAQPGQRAVNANGTPASDPLLSAAPRNPARGDLALSIGAVRTPRTDAITGRINLPVAPLRGAIPIARSDPYAPVGMRMGSFVLYSTLEQNVGASDNLEKSVGGSSGVFTDTVGSFRLLSDWSHNEAELNAVAGYRRNFAGDIKSDPRISLDGRLRLDVDRLTTATLRGAFAYAQEDPIEAGGGQSGTTRPDIYTYSAGAEVKRQFGRATGEVDLSAAREQKTKVPDSGATTTPGQDFSTYTVALRTGYDLSTAISPFVQGSLGRRIFDDDKTAAGVERNSLIEALRLGLAFDFSEKLLGELAVGYAWNVPDADSLTTTRSPTIDATIAWSPQRGTDILFAGTTNFDPDDDASTTSTLYSGSLTVRHKALQRLDLKASLTTTYRDSPIRTNRETSYGGEAGFTYWLNRDLAFTGLLRHQRFDSQQANSDYTENTAQIGLKIQR